MSLVVKIGGYPIGEATILDSTRTREGTRETLIYFCGQKFWVPTTFIEEENDG